MSSSFSHYSLVTCTGKQKSEEERLNEEDGQRRDGEFADMDQAF